MTIDSTTWQSPNRGSREGVAISAIVVHDTGGLYPGCASWLTNPASQVSAHYVITRTGRIFQLVPDALRAQHAGKAELEGETDVNSCSIGIECEHVVGQDWPAIQIATLTDLCRRLMLQYRIPAHRVVSHRFVARPIKRKVDPNDWPEADFRRWADALDVSSPPPHVDAPSAYSVQSPLLAPIATPVAVVLDRFPARLPYTNWDRQIIFRAYWDQAALMGIDPVIAVAQMAHETGDLTSFWANRPRRNPAGIGVTGETSLLPRGDGWSFDPAIKRYRKGLSFATWDQHAVPAHLARLLGYALTDAQMTSAQRAYVQRYTASRPLPAFVRGCAPTLQGLEDTWATDGNPNTESFYADRLAALANQLSGHA